MHTITAMARHYGVFPSTIHHHIKKGNLPHPKDLPIEKTIAEALATHPYPGNNSQPKGPGIRGGTRMAKSIHGKNWKHIATGPNGIGKLANHYNTTATTILTLISQGKLPDPRHKAINLTTLKHTLTPQKITNNEIEPQPGPWFDKKKNDTGLIQRMAILENKMDVIIRHLLTMKDQIG